MSRDPVTDAEGKTIHRPVIAEPVRLRPDGDDESRNFYGPADPAAGRGSRESTHGWALRTRDEYSRALQETLRGIELTDFERRSLRWLATWDGAQVVVLSLLDRLYRKGVEDGRARQ